MYISVLNIVIKHLKCVTHKIVCACEGEKSFFDIIIFFRSECFVLCQKLNTLCPNTAGKLLHKQFLLSE